MKHKYALLFFAVCLGFNCPLLGWIISGQQGWGIVGGLGASVILGAWLVRPYIKEQDHDRS